MSWDTYTLYEVRRGHRHPEKGKIKITPFIINFGGNCIESNLTKGVSVSEELALFKWSSVGYKRSTIWSK